MRWSGEHQLGLGKNKSKCKIKFTKPWLSPCSLFDHQHKELCAMFETVRGQFELQRKSNKLASKNPHEDSTYIS